jgi:hypothetical protein
MVAQCVCNARAAVRFRYGPPTFLKYMKTRKPRNHVALALSKRGGAGSHQKSHKQLRGKWKRNLES